MPTLSSIVNTCGGIPLEHLAKLIRQFESFSDEVILFFDDATPEDFVSEARRLTRYVRFLKHRDAPHEFIGEMLEQCFCDFVLRLNHDELLSANWNRESLNLLMSDGQVNSYWIARRWLVDEAGNYLSSPPHYPDFQLRLIRNLQGKVHPPALLHEPGHVEGECGWVSSHTILHYDLVWKDRAAREAKVARYAKIRPGKTGAEHYLYEDRPHAVAPSEDHGPFSAQVRLLDKTTSLARASEHSLRVAINNRTGRILSSQAKSLVFLSYHWFPDALPGAEALIWDSSRTPLRLISGMNHCVVHVVAPKEPGDYLLQIDLVEEGVTWFSQKAVDRRDFPFQAVSVY
jgi:hypothetical protein